MEKINPFTYLYYHLYLLQLEEHDVLRFLKTLVMTKGIPRAQLRKKLVFTPKLILIVFLSLGIITGLSFFFSYFFLLLFYFSFIPVIVSVLLTPLDSILKSMRISNAKKILALYPKLKILASQGVTLPY